VKFTLCWPVPEEFGAMDFGNQDTVVFDIAKECSNEFNKARDSHGSLTTRPFKMDDLSGGYPSESNSHRERDIMGLRNSFILWANYTGALSPRESSLDARLQGLPDISSMFVELLEMILRNLRRRE
jgi:hypothetical protein